MTDFDLGQSDGWHIERGENITMWDGGGDLVLWEARMNDCITKAKVPRGLTLTAEPIWTETYRGVRMVDQNGQEWGGKAVRTHRW